MSKFSTFFLTLVVSGMLFVQSAGAAFFQPVLDPSFSTGNTFFTDVSADGSVVVGSTSTALGQEAIRFENGVFTRLGDLSGGIFQSQANAISDDGSVIVGRGVSGSGTEAFRWENGVMTGLGDLPGGNFESGANAVSADGSVVVGSSRPALGALQGFRWENGVMTGIPGIPGGNGNSLGFGVSDDGAIVVGQGSNGTGTEAYRSENGVTTGLGAVLPGGFFSSSADISDDGSVIAGTSVTPDGFQAFRWESGVMTALGSFSSGSEATAVSGDGTIVVGASDDDFAAFGQLGFIWDEDNGMRSLQDFLINDLALDLGDWEIYNVQGISDDGRTLVGQVVDTVTFDQANFIANISEEPEVIPEPGSAGIFALGLIGLALYRRRSA